ncbi:MAG: cupin domain-containing protein [Thaumarchaeota archaeon]|nr:cupin domain-containing protein [Nitrososphaerota archaeon]
MKPEPRLTRGASVAPIQAPYSKPGQVESRRLITKAKDNSAKLMMGAITMKRGAEPWSWSAEEGAVFAGVDEVNYILEGKGKLSWGTETIQVEAGDAIYYPPGWKYTISNEGDTDLRFIFVLTPSIA